MKYAILFLVVFAGCHVFHAQSELDPLTTELAETHSLYNKKLKKLESIRVKSLDHNRESDGWKSKYQKWVGNAVDSIEIEHLVLSQLGLQSRRGRNDRSPGFSQKYVIHRINILKEKGVINPKNKIVLNNLVAGQLNNNELISDESLRIESSLMDLMNGQRVNYSEVKKISAFIGLRSPNVDTSSLSEMIETVRNYSIDDRAALVTYMKAMGVGYIDVKRTLHFPNLNTQTVCSKLFISYLQGECTLLHLSEDNLIMFDELLQNEIIRSVMLTKMLVLAWQQQELEELDKLEYAQKLEMSVRSRPSELFTHLEYGFSHVLSKYWLNDTSRCSFDQLLGLAYNDIYFNFKPSASLKFRRAERRIDFSMFSLNDAERSIVNGILAEDKKVTRNLLVTIVTEDILATSNWNLEFKLACYVTLFCIISPWIRQEIGTKTILYRILLNKRLLKLITKVLKLLKKNGRNVRLNASKYSSTMNLQVKHISFLRMVKVFLMFILRQMSL